MRAGIAGPVGAEVAPTASAESVDDEDVAVRPAPLKRVCVARHSLGDGEAPARRSADRGDDYLLALAEQERALLISGDQHLLALAGELPILTPRAFLDTLAEE